MQHIKVTNNEIKAQNKTGQKTRRTPEKREPEKIAGTSTEKYSGRGSESMFMGQPVISHLFFLTKPVKIEMKAMTTNRCYSLILLFT